MQMLPLDVGMRQEAVTEICNPDKRGSHWLPGGTPEIPFYIGLASIGVEV
jgi:hypothetical protein